MPALIEHGGQGDGRDLAAGRRVERVHRRGERPASRAAGVRRTPHARARRTAAAVRDRLEVVGRQAMQDVLDRRPGAVTSYVRVMQAAAALDGLNAPSVIELSTPTDREIEARVAEIAAHTRPQLEEADIFADAEVVENDPEGHA